MCTMLNLIRDFLAHRPNHLTWTTTWRIVALVHCINGRMLVTMNYRWHCHRHLQYACHSCGLYHSPPGCRYCVASNVQMVPYKLVLNLNGMPAVDDAMTTMTVLLMLLWLLQPLLSLPLLMLLHSMHSVQIDFVQWSLYHKSMPTNMVCNSRNWH